MTWSLHPLCWALVGGWVLFDIWQASKKQMLPGRHSTQLNWRRFSSLFLFSYEHSKACILSIISETLQKQILCNNEGRETEVHRWRSTDNFQWQQAGEQDQTDILGPNVGDYQCMMRKIMTILCASALKIIRHGRIVLSSSITLWLTVCQPISSLS